MKRKIQEQKILFFSLIRWVIISSFIGLIVGFLVGVFMKILNISIISVERNNLFYLLPLILVFSNFTSKKFLDESQGHGTDKIIDSIHSKGGKINILNLPLEVLTTILTIAFGGSAGKESPSAQIGGSIASFIGQFFNLKGDDLKKIVICGIGAGFSSVFGTPIAGAIFGIEVLFVGKLLYDALLPSFISSIVAVNVIHLLFNLENLTDSVVNAPSFSFYYFFISILSGIFFGIVSYLFIEIFNLFKNFSFKVQKQSYIFSLLAGFVLILIYKFVSRDFSGIGMNIVKDTLNGKIFPFYYPLLKIITLSLTLNFGGNGGLINPIFFIGSTSGTVLSTIFQGENSQFLVTLGIISLLSGTTNTPLASSILAIEIGGPKLAPFASISAIISFLITGHKSIYTSQVLAMKKVENLSGKVGDQIKGI